MEPTIIGVDMAASGQCLSAVGFWRDVPRVDDKADAFALLRRPMSFLDLATGAVAWLPTPEAEKPAQAEPQADADADADADGWIAHDGGPCPQWVKDSRAAGAKVYVRFRSGSESDTKASGSAALDVVFRNISKPGWDNLDVLAYRVVPA